MTPITAYNLKKCRHADCVLNSWNRGRDHCYFHEDRSLVESSPPILTNYINSDACNPDRPIGTFSEPNLLLVKGVAIDSHDLEVLKNNIKRPLVFSDCEFNSPDFFNAQKFAASIRLERCALSLDRDSTDVFYQCQFLGKIEIDSLVGEAHFQNCVFGGDVVLSNKDALLRPVHLKIMECRFIQEDRCANLISAGDMSWELGEIRKGLTIHAGGSVKCESLQFHSPSVIKIPEARFLTLRHVSLYSELFIQGGYASSRSLRLCIDDLVWFAGGRIHFNNVYLGSLDSTSYRFENASIFDCGFANLGNRFGLELEGEWRKFVLPAHSQTGGVVVTCRLRPDNDFGPKERLELLRDCYRNLKIYFDRSADYPMANNFHAGELWAQWRLNSYNPNKLRRLLNEFVSWRALYNWMSAFGQSWLRPLGWLCFSFLIAWELYIAIGVYPEGQWSGSYAQPSERIWQGLTLALQRLAFWFRPEGLTPLKPCHWIGWIVAFLQSSITLISAAFFLLALRRRFKR